MSRLSTLSLLLGLALVPCTGWAQSVLPNGSVEDGEGSTPDYYYREGPFDALTWASDHSLTGVRSLKAQSGWQGEAWWVSEAFPVEAGVRYRFSMWVWQEGVNTNPINDDYRWAMIIRFGTGESNGHLSGIIAPDHYTWLDQSVSDAGWYEVAVELEAPQNAQYADWDLRKRALASGQVWVDDIKAIPVGDELIPGEMNAVGIVDAISAHMTFSGDDNDNASAELSTRPTGTEIWTDQGEMNRFDGSFRLSTDTLPDLPHDVRIALDDPDGIEGPVEQILFNIEPGDEGDVTLVGWSSTYAELVSGDYTIYWDETETGGAVHVSLPNASRHLLLPLNGFGIDLLTGANSFIVIEDLFAYELTWIKEHAWGTTSTTLSVASFPVWLFWSCEASTLDGAEFTTSTWPVQFADDGVPSSTPVTVYSEQQPYATPAVLIEDTEAIQGTAMLFEYLSPWADWFDLAGELPVQGVGGNENGFGFRPPLADSPITSTDVLLSMAQLELRPGYPDDDIDVATRYSTNIALALSMGSWWDDPEQQDWQTVAAQAIDDILNTDACWTMVGQQPMLRAYVGANRPGAAEAIAQLDVLVALSYWLESHVDPDGEELAQTLTQTLPYFWNEEHQTFVNNAPNGGISTGDSWYTIQLHCDLARLAMIGNTTARNLLFDSLPAVIAFGQNVDYHFPVFFQYGTWDPISGSEPDVAGAYAWVMLAAWHMSGDQMYFDEAEAAIQALRGNGLNMTYEMHITAAASAACAKLYNITSDPEYLDLLNLSLGNLLRHFWLYEMDFGYASEYTTMCGVNAMHTIHYIAAKEQHEVYRYLREAVETAGDALDPDLETLLGRILERMNEPIWYALPPHLPAEAIDDNPQIGYNDLDLFIPLEDLRDGAQQSGQIGQELYGAGAVFTFAGGYVSVDEAQRLQHESTDSSLLNEPHILVPYPNPANPSVSFVVNFPFANSGTETRLVITNVLGQQVDQIFLHKASAGLQRISWDGSSRSSGVYFVRLVWQNGASHPQRFTILR
jgi:hypothetical protein